MSWVENEAISREPVCRFFSISFLFIPGISDLMNQAGLEGPGNMSGETSSIMVEPKGSPSNASQNSNNSVVL
jgi:hypothetical protein